nr:hypothetical protein [Mycobacteroides abscessus]
MDGALQGMHVTDERVGDARHGGHVGQGPLHDDDVFAHLVGLNLHIGHTVLHQLHVLQLTDALHADKEWDGAVLDRGALWPGNRLHACDSRHPEHGLGDLVDHQEVRRIAHIVIGLDQ